MIVDPKRSELMDRKAVTPRGRDERRRAARRYNDAGDRRGARERLERDDGRGAAGTEEEDVQVFRVYSAALKFARCLLAIVLIGVVAAVGVRLALPYLGKRLIRSDRLQKADLIVVLGSSRLERTLEAGTLYNEGWAPRILLSRPPDALRDATRQQLHLHLPVFLDLQQDVLAQMHVPRSAIALSPTTPESTREEAVAVRDYVHQYGYRRIIVVTSPYHTGRAGLLFDRAAKGSFDVVVHPDRYEPLHLDRWWRAFPDRYDVTREYQSLIYSLFW